MMDDIINLPHPVSKKHPPMPIEKRAAQFAPFAALSGHEEMLTETARVTTPQQDMSAAELLELSHRLTYALSFADRPTIEITYFRPDTQKEGGSYITVSGSIKKVEKTFNRLILADGIMIPLDAITDISGPIFAEM